jgi:hypothetical protein
MDAPEVRVLADYGEEGVADDIARRLRLLELRRLVESQTHIEPDDDEHRAGEEWDAP